MKNDKTGRKENKIRLIEKLERISCDVLKCGIGKVYKDFIIKSAGIFSAALSIDKKNTGNYYKNTPFESLLIENNDLYCETLPANYGRSYINPDYCAGLFGPKAGPVLSGIYYGFRFAITDAFMHKTDSIARYLEELINLFDYFKSAGEIKLEKLLEIEKALTLKNFDEKRITSLNEKFNPDFRFFKDIINSASREDLRYLFRYGSYISFNEIKTAAFINGLDESEISRLAKHINGAFIEGFTTENKARGTRNFVKIIYCAGYERLIKAMIEEFSKIGFETIISSVVSSNPNRQADYDHRYDEKPLLSKEYNASVTASYKKAFEKLSGTVQKYCGHIRIGKFGETPFSPAESKYGRVLNKKEEALYNKLVHETSAIFSTCVPDKNISFSIISFPAPEIGDNFEEIFREILRINTLDTNKYILMQQKIIDALDRADFIHVKGAGKNKTDIRVKMHKLAEPLKNTNFYNCGADVNIPAGEVFTTPVLKGTDGVLHVEQTYLDGFKYIDLVLKFKNGVIYDYSCANFKTASENKKYIEQNLFNLQKSLPIGEFAIGTNTLAYAVAKKYDILQKLPILITEKMGPHFAIGDSCYLYVEDIPIYNQINKKEITARDNERTILRKTDLEKAYTNVHVDITLPYESIGFIAAVDSRKKSVNIIEKGRFVLKGCEPLNAPLDKKE
ncbi:MAG TPA: aminopeptidase [Candidatus Wallbacteria bacterium]|nr:MAG: Thermophilic metalloprotease (M29) [bacterium ADurb.Bin243]HOD39439.1 aminopeptidase [Candidatus Wallbacteria bacterium]HPG57577.1 aminopeptidase [Candidatus Wallbacteria bacterium]